jgi:UDP-glucuronate 4-epimerase
VPPVLVTGAAGFIGYHVAERLLAAGERVVGVDRLDDYYDPALKEARLARLCRAPGFEAVRLDLADRDATEALFARVRPAQVVHLAAQAGVRYSVANPHRYVDANIVAFLHVLEGCRHHDVAHLLYASSSSVYGANTTMPFSVHAPADHPLSLYAATKRANELMAHSYSATFGVPTTGARLFTVYGPWGRPDMAIAQFTSAILAGEPVTLYNGGAMRRDFTYVDDIVDGLIGLLARVPAGHAGVDDPSRSNAPYCLYDLGNGAPRGLGDYVSAIEAATGCVATRVYAPAQPGEVPDTWADITDARRDIGFAPKTSLEEGVARYVAWHREWFGV